MVIVSCKLCSKEFSVKPSWIKLGYGKYCSRVCQYQGRKNGKLVHCSVCGKETYKNNKAINGSKSGKYFCGKSCQTVWRNSEFVGKKHANYINGNASYKSILGRHKVPKVCGLCGTKDLRVLAVHHIDEDHGNNVLENLAWLCHNCHFLVHHDKVEKARFFASR